MGLRIFTWWMVLFTQFVFSENFTNFENVDNVLSKEEIIISEAEQYYQMGIDLFHQNKYKEAIHKFQKSVDLNDEIYSIKSLLNLVYLKATLGEKSLDNYWDTLPQRDKINVQYKVVEGWQYYIRKHSKNKKYNRLINDVLSSLSNQNIQNQSVQNSILSLASSYLKLEKYNLALNELVKIIANKSKLNSQQLENAWYLMGVIFLESNQFYDPDRAKESLNHILKNKASVYYHKALEKISQLN